MDTDTLLVLHCAAPDCPNLQEAGSYYCAEHRERDEQKTIVVFRRWKSIGTIIALFPEHPSDPHGKHCDSYESTGGHGGADYYAMIQATTPVKPEDYEDLAEELRNIGYNLKPVKRASWKHHEKKMQNLSTSQPKEKG